MSVKFNLPMMNGDAGKFLQVNSTETDYQWTDIAIEGQAYRRIEGNLTPEVQRSILNFSALFSVSDNLGNLSTDVDINVSALATDSTFITDLTDNTTFLENIANSTTFVETLIANTTFITDLTSDTTFVTNITTIVTTGGGVLFQTNSVDNGNQAELNLIEGTNMSISDDGMGNITFDASSGASTNIQLSVNQTTHGFSEGDIIKSSGTANEYAKAVGDNAADAEVVGIVTTVIDANNFIYSQNIMGYTGTGIPTGTPGEGIFLDQATAGAMTLTVSSATSGLVVKPVGVLLASGAKMNFSSSYLGLINP